MKNIQLPGVKYYNSYKSVAAVCIIMLLLLFSSCITAPMEINPVYATRSLRQVSGEINLGEVQFEGAESSLGAVRPAEPLPYFCRNALLQELEAFGLKPDDKAPLRLEADIRKAETVWRNQGDAGVYTTTFVIAFQITNRQKQSVYNKIHRGVASHSQSYGGYPASAAFTEALATTYERFLQDPELIQTLKKGGAVNLVNSMNTSNKADLSKELFRDYTDAVSAVAPHLTEVLEPRKYDEVIGIIGFMNSEGSENNLSKALVSTLRDYLVANRYQVVSRNLKEIFLEQKLQLSGLTDESTIVEIGKIAGASVLVSGDLYFIKEDGIIQWDLSLLDVETGLTEAAFSIYMTASEKHLNMLDTTEIH